MNKEKIEEKYPRTVLIVEDDTGLNNLIRKNLQRIGLESESFFSGKDALERIEREPESLILLLDYRLLDMTSYELIDALSKKNLFVPFIIMTGHGDEKVAVDMMKLGARDYLVKQTDFLDLLPGVVGNLVQDLNRETELKIMEEKLQIFEEKHRLLYETMAQGVLYFDNDGRVISANLAAEQLLGTACNDMVDINTLIMRFKPAGEDGTELDSTTCPMTRPLITGEIEKDVLMGINNPDKNNQQWFVVDSIPQFRPGEEKPYQTFATLTDVTGRINAEAKIKISLKEKEILLKEVHHRVKNNLQVISSLLSLQSEYIVDSRDSELFKDCQNRIHSMSLIHEKLYQSENLSRINLHDYIETLVTEIKNSYHIPGTEIKVDLKIENISLGIDTAINCALIVNELFSNSIKYAFPDSKKGTIVIAMSQESRDYILSIKDDGIGLPEDFDYQKVESLGLKLVYALTKQLKGGIERIKGKGTGFVIRFSGKPEKNKKE